MAGDIIRFGVFELDRAAAELRRQGRRIRLSGQPLAILEVLLDRPGKVVTREELRARLWRDDTFVDFDHSLNTAVNKLREALGDSADTPRFVETVPRRGYRFIAPVERPVPPAEATPAGAAPAGAAPASRPATRAWLAYAMVALLVLAAVLLVFRDRAPRQPIRSIAVLPLANLSGDAAQEYFADGVTEALISQLAQAGGLRLISRTSVMQYKQTQKSVPQIAQELAVGAVVEGSVQRAGGRVRVSVQLIDGKTDAHLWAATFDREEREVLALQSDLARAIAAEIAVQIGGRMPSRPADPAAYDAYLRGRYHFHQGRCREAVPLLEESLARDPAYPPAQAALADCNIILSDSSPLDSGLFARGREAAIAAVKADPNSGEAQTSMALALFYYDRDIAGATAAIKRALELRPGHAFNHAAQADMLAATGRFDEALASARRAADLDPFAPQYMAGIGRQLYFARKFPQAIAELGRAREREPRNTGTLRSLTVAYEQAGTPARSVALLESASRPAQLARALARAGQRQRALELLKPLTPASPAMLFDLACAWTALNERSRALDLLEQAANAHARPVMFVGVDPQFDALRAEPRFRQLLQALGLPRG